MFAPDGRWFNVKEYGAVGNGFADDTKAIAEAFAHANAVVLSNPAGVAFEGVVVYFPAGVYRVRGDSAPIAERQGTGNYLVGSRVYVFGPAATINHEGLSGHCIEFTHDYGNLHLNGIASYATSGSANGLVFKGAQYCRAVINIITGFRGANVVFKSQDAWRNTHDNVLHVGQLIGHLTVGGNLLFESKSQASDGSVEGNTVHGGLVLYGFDYCCRFGSDIAQNTARWNKVFGALHGKDPSKPVLEIYNDGNTFSGDFFQDSGGTNFVKFFGADDTLIISSMLGEGQYTGLGTRRASLFTQTTIQKDRFAINRETDFEIVRDRSRTDMWWMSMDRSTGSVEFLGGADLPAGAKFKSNRDIEAPNIGRQTVDGWFRDDIAANLAATEMTRPQRWRAIRSGSITGIIVELMPNQARTAGSLTAEVYKATVNPTTGARTPVSTGLTVTLDGANPCFAATTQGKDLDLFAVGDELYVMVTSSGWAPTTADARASIEIET